METPTGRVGMNLRSSNGVPRGHGTVLLPGATGEPEPGVTPTQITGACTGSPRLSPIPLHPHALHQPGAMEKEGPGAWAEGANTSLVVFSICKTGSPGLTPKSIYPSILPNAACLSPGAEVSRGY